MRKPASNAAKVVLKFACAVVLLAAASAMPATQNSVDTKALTFRSRAELVLVPVVVTRNGKHVLGLKKEDFAVLEDGARQQIVSFEEVSGVTEPVRWPVAVSGIFTNSAFPEQRTGHPTVFLFDLLNTPFPKQAFARQSLVKFLGALPGSRDPMMLAVMMPDGLRVVHGFTSDPAQLRDSLSQIKTWLSDQESPAGGLRSEQEARQAAIQAVSADNQGHPERNPEEIERLAELFRDIPKALQQARDINRTQRTLEQLQQLAHGLVGIPGRKSLIWVTGGLTYAAGADIPYGLNTDPPKKRHTPGTLLSDVADSNDRFDLTWAVLSDASIAVYPIDVAEMENTCYPDASLAAAKCGEHSLREFTWGLRAQAMHAFADKTGGTYCPLQSRLEDCFRLAADDSAQYYMIAFRPAGPGKSSWRKLSVKVAIPGARVSSRTGYFANDRKQTPEARNAQMVEAIASALDATAIPIAMHWLKDETKVSTPNTKLGFEIFIDPSAIAFDGDGHNHFHLTLTVAHRNEKGDMIRDLAKDIEGQPQPERLTTLLDKGLLYRDNIEVPTGGSEIRFVVRDEISGRIGSVTAKAIRE